MRQSGGYMARVKRWAAVAAAMAALAGCGSSDDPADFPAPATAAPSPPLTADPAGLPDQVTVMVEPDPTRARLEDGTMHDW